MPLERNAAKKDKPAPFNVPTDHALPPADVMGAAYGPVTAPPTLGSPAVPVNLVDNLTPLVNNVTDSEEEEEDPVSSEGEVDEQYSHSVGPNSYIFKKIKQVDDLDECAAILALTTARFKYLNLENCLCGKRLTKNYVESRTCKTCTLVEKKKATPMCSNCHLITLKGKWKDVGYCKHCRDALQRVELKKNKIVEK
jgi:hypothetical protein